MSLDPKILENHGYAVTHRALAEDLADCLPSDFESSFNLPHIGCLDEAIVAKELTNSAKRFTFVRLFKSIFS